MVAGDETSAVPLVRRRAWGRRSKVANRAQGAVAPRHAAPPGALRRAQVLLARVQTRRISIPPDRFEAAVVAKRMLGLSIALAIFALGFSLDDVHVLRAPGYLVGAIAAILVLAVGPLLLGRSFALAHREDDAARFLARVAQSRRVSVLTFLVTFLAFLAWLVVFSSGVPPWAA